MDGGHEARRPLAWCLQVIVAIGGSIGGWSLYTLNGKVGATR